MFAAMSGHGLLSEVNCTLIILKDWDQIIDLISEFFQKYAILHGLITGISQLHIFCFGGTLSDSLLLARAP